MAPKRRGKGKKGKKSGAERTAKYEQKKLTRELYALLDSSPVLLELYCLYADPASRGEEAPELGGFPYQAQLSGCGWGAVRHTRLPRHGTHTLHRTSMERYTKPAWSCHGTVMGQSRQVHGPGGCVPPLSPATSACASVCVRVRARAHAGARAIAEPAGDDIS